MVFFGNVLFHFRADDPPEALGEEEEGEPEQDVLVVDVEPPVSASLEVPVVDPGEVRATEPTAKPRRCCSDLVEYVVMSASTFMARARTVGRLSKLE